MPAQEITFSRLCQIMENSFAVIVDNDALVYPSISESPLNEDERVIELSWDDADSNHFELFIDKDTQNIKIENGELSFELEGETYTISALAKQAINPGVSATQSIAAQASSPLQSSGAREVLAKSLAAGDFICNLEDFEAAYDASQTEEFDEIKPVIWEPFENYGLDEVASLIEERFTSITSTLKAYEGHIKRGMTVLAISDSLSQDVGGYNLDEMATIGMNTGRPQVIDGQPATFDLTSATWETKDGRLYAFDYETGLPTEEMGDHLRPQ